MCNDDKRNYHAKGCARRISIWPVLEIIPWYAFFFLFFGNTWNMVHLLEEKTVFKGKKRRQSRRSLSMFKLYYATFHPVKSREARKLLHILLNDTEVGLVPVFSINLSRIGNVTAWKRKKEKKKVTQFFLQISTFELLFEQSIIMIGKVETIFVLKLNDRNESIGMRL